MRIYCEKCKSTNLKKLGDAFYMGKKEIKYQCKMCGDKFAAFTHIVIKEEPEVIACTKPY